MTELKSETKKSSLFIFLCVLLNITLFIGVNFSYNSNQYIRDRKNSPPSERIIKEYIQAYDVAQPLTTIEKSYSFLEANSYMVVEKNNTNIRIFPSDESAIIKEINAGCILNITGKDIGNSNGWTKVNFQNQTGYIKTLSLSDWH